jgi:hypothetical protein
MLKKADCLAAIFRTKSAFEQRFRPEPLLAPSMIFAAKQQLQD